MYLFFGRGWGDGSEGGDLTGELNFFGFFCLFYLSIYLYLFVNVESGRVCRYCALVSVMGERVTLKH